MGKRNRYSQEQKQSKLVDICILTAGRFDMLEKCLEAVEREINSVSYGCNVYLLDNGSDAEERIQHNDLFSKEFITSVKRINPNSGFPKGANSLIAMGKAPLVVFITDDVVYAEGTLDKLVRRMDDQSIGICGLKLLFPKDTTTRPAGKVQHVGHSVNIRGEIIHPLLGWAADNSKTCISREVFSVTGASFIVRRNAFTKAGGFDEVYGRGTYEDVSLCLSLRQLGYKIYIDTECVASHYTGATVEKLKVGYPLDINSMIFKSKWMPTGLVIWDEASFW